MLIVPDVHGRVFWKKALNDIKDEIVFLGDYVDPYPDEGISREQTIEVLKEIISLKEQYPDKITLLLGNHDLMYLHDYHREMACRHDRKNEKLITQLLWRPELFSLALKKELNGKTYIFSHSGIHPWWLENHSEYKDNPVESLNEYLWKEGNERDILMKSLTEVSFYRGGWDFPGSPVWADIREWFQENLTFDPSIFQIFGHTLLREPNPIQTENFAEIDCSQVFKLTDNNGTEKTILNIYLGD